LTQGVSMAFWERAFMMLKIMSRSPTQGTEAPLVGPKAASSSK
jgi:hypothetical protein